jgi:alcohol dehydrogenase class IV
VGVKGTEPELAARAFAKKIRQLQKTVGFPLSLKQAGVSKEIFEKGLDKLVQYAMMDSSITMNPRDTDSDRIRKMYEYMYLGKPIDF